MSRVTYLSLVSVYAPTYNSPQEQKDVFYDDLCCTINSVSENDILIVLGNFNARVGAGSSEMETSQWDGVKGQHGVGKTNEAGTSLITFCALNGLTVMNAWFEKKDMYKYIWQHPGSKKWHCIDYILMRTLKESFVVMFLLFVRQIVGLTINC